VFTEVKRGGEKMSVFGAEKIITEKIAETDLAAYLVGFDVDDDGNNVYRLKSLVQLLLKAIPEFAMGYFGNAGSTPNTEIMDVVTDSAKAIYKIDAFQKVRDLYGNGAEIDDEVADRYLRKGEFGELILHVLLRDFKNTIPLISKIYFRDSFGTAVHGFDAIHIQPDTKTLWLGESKIYKDGKTGIRSLIQDIQDHIQGEYMESEFAIVSRKVKLFEDIPDRQYWLDLMDKTTTLKEQLNDIVIPLLCTYESENFSKYNDEGLQEFITAYESEVRELKKYFDDNNNHRLKSKLKIILILFPVQSKKELVAGLHRNLSRLQSVGEIL